MQFSQLLWKLPIQLDVNPQRDDDASPMSTCRCMLIPTWMISALQHKSKYKSNSISNFFEKKNQIFWFPCCSTREDLSVALSITYVGLILTKPGRFFFSAYGNSMYGQNSISSISNFWKNFHIYGFPWCSTREDHSIDVSITEDAGLWPCVIVPTELCPLDCAHWTVPTRYCAQPQLWPHGTVPNRNCAHTGLCPSLIVPTRYCAQP